MQAGGRGVVTDKEKAIFDDMIKELYDLPMSERNLNAVMGLVPQFLSENEDKASLFERLDPWTLDDQGNAKTPNAEYFNGSRDVLDFSSNVVAFDMSICLNNPDLLPPLSTYIFHRFQKMFMENPSPHIIFVDEMPQYLKSDAFGSHLIEIARRARKNNGIFFGALQEPGDIVNTSRGMELLQNLATVIIFPNLNANEKEYAALGLTDSEIEWVKKPTSDREVMIKRVTSGESVIVNVDLSGLEELIHLFDGGSERLHLKQRLKSVHGDAWVKQYLEERYKASKGALYESSL